MNLLNTSKSVAFHPFPNYPEIPGLGGGNRGGSRRFRTRFLIRWNQNGILVPLAGTPQEFRWRGGADGTPDLGAFSRPPGGAFFRRGGASRRPDYELIQEHPGKRIAESDLWPAGGD